MYKITNIQYIYILKTISNLSLFINEVGLGGSVGCASNWRSGGCGFVPHRVGNTFVEIDHEIFSTVILSLPLIQIGQLSVSGERMCTMRVSFCRVSSIEL